MRPKRNLKGRRIAVLAADGFEKVELTIPVSALRLSGATCHVISLRHGRIRGVNLHEPASRGSDPQRDEPPALVVKTMQWMPRPSLRTAVALGAIAAGVIASNRRWR